jgi:hypothetical protein
MKNVMLLNLMTLIGWMVSSPFSLAGSPMPGPLGTAGNLTLETSRIMAENAHPDRQTAPADWRNLSGAAGLNLIWEKDPSQPWFIEYQKVGRDWVAAGLASGDKDKVRWGLKILEWGFSRMESDGEFKHADSYHSASFFVEAVVHVILMLEASPWRAEFGIVIEGFKPKLLTAARWMIRPDIDALNWPDDNNYPRIFGERRYAHRRFLDAAAIGGVGLIFQDKPLMEKGVWLIRNGIAFQQSDGINPERGGSDTSYQALGLVYACRYYQTIADDAMRAEMIPAMEKGYAWLLGRIKPDGDIDATGNTRTGDSGEPSRDGKPKRLDYHTTAISIACWAQLTGNAELDATARRVFAFGRTRKSK